MALTATATETSRDGPVAASATRPVRLAGSPQQRAFWAELLDGSGNGLLEARAGTGKSSSCREGMHRLAEAGGRPRIRYCCFNKKVADEFREGCPAGVDVGTMHSFGLQALRRAGACRVEPDKTYTILDGLDAGARLPRYLRKAVATAVSLAKNYGLLPGSPGLAKALDDLIVHHDVECWRRDGDVADLAVDVLARSAQMTELVDFDDMLWLPVVLGVNFPDVDFLFIDEVQDLNAIQHALVPRLNPHGRTIIVGDPFQSIYAFRGADSESIPKLRDQLGARVLPLTVTWRCPRSHVELARQLVPDFEAAPDAPDGRLETAGPEAIEGAGPGDLVLCRSNAPIIAHCLKAIGARRRAIVRGRAIGDQLASVARRVEADTIGQFQFGLRSWRAAELARLSGRDGTEHLMEQVNDKAMCLEAIAETCGSPSEIPGVIRHLFDDTLADNRVTFSSVHRAKGSEARTVYYIQVPFNEQRDRLKPPPAWEVQQRRNLRYVACTRSLDRLVLIA